MAFLSYRQPGVYTRYVDDPNLVRAFGFFRIPAIVGPGKDTITIENQVMERSFSRSLSPDSTTAPDGMGVSFTDVTEIILTTADHELVVGDLIEFTDTAASALMPKERAYVVDVDGTTITIDKYPDNATLDAIGWPYDDEDHPGTGTPYTYITATTTILEISQKDLLIPGTDNIIPANLMDEDGNLVEDIADASFAEAIVRCGFAPWLNNYRADIDYAARLKVDTDLNWYIEWLKAGHVLYENLADNGRNNDITSGTAKYFKLGRQGLVNSDGDIEEEDYSDVIADMSLWKWDPNAIDPITLLRGAYIPALNKSGVPYIISTSAEDDVFDPISSKITLSPVPTAQELQDGIFVTYYFGNNTPALRETYYVSYDVKKSDEYYMPALYTDLSQVIFDFGTPNLENPISLAANLSMVAGSSRILLTQTKKTEGTFPDRISGIQDYLDAFEALEAEELSTLVPLSVDIVIQQYAFQHCVKMSSILYRKERFMLMTLDVSNVESKQEEVDLFVETSSAYSMTGSGERVVIIAPGVVKLPTQDEMGVVTTELVPSYYAAAAMMGGLMRRDPAEPPTRKQIVGFSGLGGSYKYTEADMDYMAGNGTCVLLEQAGVIIIRHGLTTDKTSPNKSEISVVQIKDFVVKQLREGLEGAYIGRKIVPETILGLRLSTEAILGRLKVNQIINDYANVQVAEDLFDPTQLNVSFQMKPIYPLNYIFITITLNARLGTAQ